MIIKNGRTFKVLSKGELTEYPTELSAIKAEYGWKMTLLMLEVLNEKWNKVSNDDIRKMLAPVPAFTSAKLERGYQHYTKNTANNPVTHSGIALTKLIND